MFIRNIRINNMSKYYRYSHERSSLLDILNQKKSKLIPDENDKSYKLMNVFQTKRVINLFGEKKLVDQASLEILTFSEEKFKHIANVVYYPELLAKLTSKNSINQVVINKCYNMDCNNIILLNSTIVGMWIPYNLYVVPNCINNNSILNDCKQINGIYNIRSEKMSKKDQINKILD